MFRAALSATVNGAPQNIPVAIPSNEVVAKSVQDASTEAKNTDMLSVSMIRLQIVSYVGKLIR